MKKNIKMKNKGFNYSIFLFLGLYLNYFRLLLYFNLLYYILFLLVN